MSLRILILKGCPASGKSSFCKDLMKKESGKWKRINNDSLRESIDISEFSTSNEKIIKNLRDHLLREFIKKDYNVIIDNVNATSQHFDDVVKVAKTFNKDVYITEKPFYVELEEAIARDSKREDKAKVGEEVVRKFWKKLGGKQFKFYNPKVEVINKTEIAEYQPMVQDENLHKATVWDNDGTISIIHKGRSPYDASTCDLDHPHKHVIECMKLYHDAGYKILFVSGREEKDREPTEKFYKQHFPDVKYELYMRPTGDQRKDVIIKEEIFNNHIKDKYYVAGWFDDRLQVSRWVHQVGLPLFRVNDPEAVF